MTAIEQLKQKLENDPEFAESLKSASDKNEVLQKIKDAGIDITPEALSEVVSTWEGELDDSVLDAVTGGGDWTDNYLNKPKKKNATREHPIELQ